MSENRDDDTRLGVGVFELPKNDPLNESARGHDFEYEQAHLGQPHMSREEADDRFARGIKLLAENNSWEGGSGFDRGWNRFRAWLFTQIVKGPLGRLAWKGLFYHKKPRDLD